MSARDRWISRHLRRLHFGQFLQRTAEWMAVYLFAFGGLVLVVKLFLPSLWPNVLWLGLGAVPVTIVAWVFARRGRFTRPESVAMLDRSLGTGGLLMTLCETPDLEWEMRLPEVERAWKNGMPRIRPRRFVSYLGLPILFAIGVCFVPLRDLSARLLPPRTVGRQATAELEELLEIAEEAEILDEQEEQQLREEIARLAEETEEAPLTHEKWETVDALEQQLRMQMSESVSMAEQAASAADLLAEVASGEAFDISPERMAALEDAVMQALQQMQRSGMMPGELSAEMQQLLERMKQEGRGTRLPEDGAHRQQLLSELREMLEREKQRLAAARQKCQSGQCEGEGQGQCSQCGQSGQCNGQGLCASCAGGATRDGDGNPGRGGINRGRGDAEMNWGDESDEKGTQFEETVLPPGFSEEPGEDILGLSLAPAEDDPAASAPRAAGRDDGPTGGQETWDRQLRPRHRDVVRQYFNTGDSGGE